MAEIPSNIPGAPQGAEPMKKSTGKVQPKKETVRINLPPKPSAAPTIKLPTLPPGGAGVPTMAQTSAAAPAAAPAAPRAAAAPAPALRPGATSVPAATQQRPVAPVAAAAPKTMNSVDRILIYAATFAALIAVGSTVFLAFFFKDTH
jgi:translation initiation factor IF-3